MWQRILLIDSDRIEAASQEWNTRCCEWNESQQQREWIQPIPAGQSEWMESQHQLIKSVEATMTK